MRVRADVATLVAGLAVLVLGGVLLAASLGVGGGMWWLAHQRTTRLEPLGDESTHVQPAPEAAPPPAVPTVGATTQGALRPAEHATPAEPPSAPAPSPPVRTLTPTTPAVASPE